MSLKALELQIAIPKTYDAGKIAQQHQQNVIQEQVNANEALKKEIKRKQLAVLDTENTKQISDEEKHKQEHDRQQCKKKQQEKSQENKAQHPFKGNFIDFSG